MHTRFDEFRAGIRGGEACHAISIVVAIAHGLKVDIERRWRKGEEERRRGKSRRERVGRYIEIAWIDALRCLSHLIIGFLPLQSAPNDHSLSILFIKFTATNSLGSKKVPFERTFLVRMEKLISRYSEERKILAQSPSGKFSIGVSLRSLGRSPKRFKIVRANEGRTCWSKTRGTTKGRRGRGRAALSDEPASREIDSSILCAAARGLVPP